MTTMLYHEARTRSLARELDNDPTILLIGGDPWRELPEDFASRYSDRILWPPVSEFSCAGAAVGAAIAGFRPFFGIHTSSFMFYGWSPIVNEAPNVRYLSAGAVKAPAVFHVMAGSRRGGGPQHQHTPQAMLQNVPGLRVLAPGTPAQVDSVLHAALTGEDPTVIVDNPLLGPSSGDVGELPAPLRPVEVLRKGAEVAVVSYSIMTKHALSAAELLVNEGLDLEVLSVPVLSPSPAAALREALEGFSAVVFADESRASGSPAASWIADLAEHRAKMPKVELVCTKDAPTPFSPHLCDAVVPGRDDIVRAVRSLRSSAGSS